MTSHIKPISKRMREKYTQGEVTLAQLEKLLNQAIKEVRG